MTSLPSRLPLAQLPTPLQRMDRLSELWGGPTIWVKRDDLTGFGLSGNKVRKLEFHVAAAKAAGAHTLITCGAAQSNHSRTTAIAGAIQGFNVHLFLRTPDGQPPAERKGNHLIDMLAGATITWVTPDQYNARDELMAEHAATLDGGGWVIPEGASDALGMWGFVAAMQELDPQLSMVANCAAIWHTSSSGGTTAGLGWAADRLGLTTPIVAASIDMPAVELTERVHDIWNDALAEFGGKPPQPDLEYLDDYIGLGYGKTTPEELLIQAEITAHTGLILDPTYTGKGFYALRQEIAAGRYSTDDAVVFWHTGGGFAVFSHDFDGMPG